MSAPTKPTPLQALRKVQAAAEQRERDIEKSKEMYRKIEEEADARRRDARTIHRNANRRLIAAIREANQAGLRLRDLAEAISRSYQFINQLEAQARKWDIEEEAERKNGTSE